MHGPRAQVPGRKRIETEGATPVEFDLTSLAPDWCHMTLFGCKGAWEMEFGKLGRKTGCWKWRLGQLTSCVCQTLGSLFLAWAVVSDMWLLWRIQEQVYPADNREEHTFFVPQGLRSAEAEQVRVRSALRRSSPLPDLQVRDSEQSRDLPRQAKYLSCVSYSLG